MGDQRHINHLASRQYGVFNTRQAREAGFDKSAVWRKVQSGAWIELDANVYSVASAAPKWERQQAALVLSRPKAVVAGRAAAYLHGLRGFGSTRPTILVPPTSNTRSRLGRVVRAQLFDQIATVEVAGFQVTTVVETLLLLARDLGPSRLEDVFDDALLSRRLKLKLFDPILEREEGRRTKGFNLVKGLVEDRRPSAPSVGATYLEAMLERILRGATLPRWIREHPFTLGGDPARVDVFLPDWRLVIEADGRSWHMRTSDFEKDRQRDNQLAVQGIQVLRFTYRMLREDPEGCLANILDRRPG
jgi:very-short-patch-repair endonuclease